MKIELGQTGSVDLILSRSRHAYLDSPGVGTGNRQPVRSHPGVRLSIFVELMNATNVQKMAIFILKAVRAYLVVYKPPEKGVMKARPAALN